jgi:hypothetical protein
MSQFPAAAHDDDVDSTSQVLTYLRTSDLNLGLIDFYKRVAASANPDAMVMGTAKADNSLAPVDELRCANCSNDFIQTLRSGIKRCGQCAFQWDPRPALPPHPSQIRQSAWRM